MSPLGRFAACLGLALSGAGVQAWPCPGNTTAEEVVVGMDLSGKVAIVTGGDSGLGYAMALELARQKATVVIANHNQTNGEIAARNITAATGRSVHAMSLNLGSLESVRRFAHDFLSEHGLRLHLLINNAGISRPSVMTTDGFELVFEVDYLGHFLLTELLLPALRASAPARVVNVASGAHENACESAGWDVDCFKDWTYLPPPVVPVRNVTVHYRSGAKVVLSSSYGIGKFAQVQHAAALARREAAAGVEAFSVTPGLALTGMTSGIDPDSPVIKAFCQAQIHPSPELPPNPCPFSAEQGAAVIAACAAGQVSPSGAYFSRTLACGESPIAMQGFTEAMQDEFYERSLGWVGLSPPRGPAASRSEGDAIQV